MTDPPDSLLARTPDGRRVLACAALRPELGSVLVYDAEPGTLDSIAVCLLELLSAITDQVEDVRLGPALTDDDLWGYGEGLPAPWRRPGLLIAPEGHFRLVVIPDLAQLSLAAARAAVMLMGEGAGHLQRHGQNRVFEPRLRWLAACRREDLGRVSPHLLDRFALRLQHRAARAEDRVASLTELIRGDRRDVRAATAEEVRNLREATGRCPRWQPAAGKAVTSYGLLERAGMRQELALAQAARALAQLAGAQSVGEDHVHEAAAVFGFAQGSVDSDDRVESRTAEPSCPAEPAQVVPPAEPVSASEGPTSTATEGGVAIRGPETTLPAFPLSGPELPEKTAAVERDYAPLTLPVRQARATARGRGPIIGVRPATSLTDLAMVGTVLAALQFQAVRHGTADWADRAPLLLQRSDLREYRRAPIAQDLLVLVLDYTCLAGRDWHAALLPYLAAAYQARAEVCLVAVGAHDAAEPLRAEALNARSILVPAVAAALDRRAGKATPLADGLALARDTIRRTLFHGRSAIQRVTLVVLTDGRGNVPIAVSREGRVIGRVTRQGIDDARRMAQELRGIERVTSVVLDPRPRELADLPRVLAEALGAEVVAVPEALPEVVP